MFRPLTTFHTLLTAALWLALISPSFAARPSETLLPNDTVGWLSVGDLERLRKTWDETQLGQLMQDPQMQPFANDLRAQLKERWGMTFSRLGLTSEDFEGVPSGETAFALILPAPHKSAVAVVMDVTGHTDEAQAVIAKAGKNLAKHKATSTVRTVHGSVVTTYNIPPDENHTVARQAVFFISQDTFCATDNAAVSDEMLRRFDAKAIDSLSALPAFAAAIDRAANAAGQMAPEARWFVRPFGFVEASRATEQGAAAAKKRGKDFAKILAEQGFTAVQGVGGYINFRADNGKYDMLHRTKIYAPAVREAKEDERYLLAARMLRFPNSDDLSPQGWVPRELATYLSFNLEVKQAFEFSSTLVDAIVGEEGVFEEVIESIFTDPNGPQIDIRKDIVAHLGTRCTLITDYALPITPTSERMVFGINTTDEATLAKSIEKMMETDPDAERREFEGHVIWEIIDPDAGVPQLEVDVPAFDPLQQGNAPKRAKEERKITNAAVCVANGHIFVASHIEFLKKILVKAEARDTLARAADFRVIASNLKTLQPGNYSFLMFSRTEEEYRPTYELIRAGKMPEAQTMLGQFLNTLLGEGKEGQRRVQRINGRNLPEFEVVRRYLGPAGLIVSTEDDGWFLQGIVLSKEGE